MRRKIAKRWRKKVLRMGAVILKENFLFSKKELRMMGLKPSDNGFAIEITFNGHSYLITDNTELDAYKLMVWVLEDEVLDGRETGCKQEAGSR